MSSSITLVVNDKDGFSSTDRNDQLRKESKLQFLQNFISYLAKIGSGNAPAVCRLDISSAALVAATGNVTMASPVAGDTVSLNGVAFTAVTGSPAAQQFQVGTTDLRAATSLAAAVNASTDALVAAFFSASASTAVCQIAAKAPGILGNAFTIASSDNGRLAVAPGARLAGGTGGYSSTGPSSYVFGASSSD